MNVYSFRKKIYQKMNTFYQGVGCDSLESHSFSVLRNICMFFSIFIFE